MHYGRRRTSSKRKAGGDESRAWLLTSVEAADYLRVSLPVLWKAEREGLLAPYRTPGGHRRYSVKMLNEYLEESRR